MLQSDQQRLKTLLQEAIPLMCKNGLNFKQDLCLEALIGITLDQDVMIHFSIKETIKNELEEPESSADVDEPDEEEVERRRDYRHERSPTKHRHREHRTSPSKRSFQPDIDSDSEERLKKCKQEQFDDDDDDDNDDIVFIKDEPPDDHEMQMLGQTFDTNSPYMTGASHYPLASTSQSDLPGQSQLDIASMAHNISASTVSRAAVDPGGQHSQQGDYSLAVQGYDTNTSLLYDPQPQNTGFSPKPQGISQQPEPTWPIWKSPEKSFPCRICEKVFKKNWTLQDHVAVVHFNQLFTCPVCGLQFKWRTHLYKHRREQCVSAKEKDKGEDKDKDEDLNPDHNYSTFPVIPN